MQSCNTPKGCLVCFVGIDGSGKSTLARALTSIVEEQDVECKYVWGGFTSSFVIFRPFVAVLKRSAFSGISYMEESSTKGRVLKNSRLSALYQYLALTDYIVQALFRIKFPLARGTNVICDRYIHDLVASISVILDYPANRTKTLLHRCLAFVPRPDLAFLVDLPETVAYQRKDDIVSLDFLSARRDVYLLMAEHERMTILDGTRERLELEQLAATTVLPLITGEA